MTYQERYMQHLEALLDAGGKQEDIEKVVAEYNEPTADALTAWLQTKPTVICSTCGEAFKPGSGTLSQEILCPNHT